MQNHVLVTCLHSEMYFRSVSVNLYTSKTAEFRVSSSMIPRIRSSITEDFSKPKVLWKRVGSILRFCYNDNEALGLDSTCFAIGNNIEFVCCVLNTPMGHYLLKDAPKTGTGDLLISVQAVEPIKLPSVTHELNIEFKRLLEMMIANCSDDIENEISQKIFNLYGLSHEEQRYIEENFT